MSLREFLRELVFPATSTTTVLALFTFVVLIRLAMAAGLFGLWLLIATLPALLRYLTMIAEARAAGIDTPPPGIEFFTLVGNLWALFPVIPAVALAYALRVIEQFVGAIPALAVALGAAAIVPAMIGLLVLTHSPLTAVDPRAIGRFMIRCGGNYWYAPATAVLVVAPVMPKSMPAFATIALEIYLAAALFAVIGGVTRHSALTDEVELPDAAEPGQEKVREADIRERSRVLNHAYGFASRGNRDGALAHIYDWLSQDPEPDAAWPWFLERMLRWDDVYPGLLYAQQYLGRLLALGNQVAAVKLMLRCRMLNEGFRPLGPDLPAAMDAARACGNDELLAALSD